jgi:hypothetical protein
VEVAIRMAINEIPPDQQPETVTRERVPPESTPTDLAMTLLESWRDDALKLRVVGSRSARPMFSAR